MSTESDFLTVVDNIQAAALDAELWAPALDSIADLVGGAVATTELIEIERARPVYADFSDRLNTETVNEYLYYYSGINPRIADGMGRRAGTVRYDHAFMTDAEIDRDEYYADFVRPLDLIERTFNRDYRETFEEDLFDDLDDLITELIKNDFDPSGKTEPVEGVGAVAPLLRDADRGTVDEQNDSVMDELENFFVKM